MENFIKKRYWLHLGFFFFLGYVVIFWADFKDFSIQDKIAGFLAMVVFLGICVSGGIEWCQVKLVKLFYPKVDPFDKFDILWSAIGVALGSIVYYLYPNEKLNQISFVMVIIGTVYELTRMVIVFGREYLKRRNQLNK